jgi:hypothetical protein
MAPCEQSAELWNMDQNLWDMDTPRQIPDNPLRLCHLFTWLGTRWDTPPAWMVLVDEAKSGDESSASNVGRAVGNFAEPAIVIGWWNIRLFLRQLPLPPHCCWFALDLQGT